MCRYRELEQMCAPSVYCGVKYHQNVLNVHRYIRNYVGAVGPSTKYVHYTLHSSAPLPPPFIVDFRMYCRIVE